MADTDPHFIIETSLYAMGFNYVKEYKFSSRKSKFDYAIPEIKLAIEYEGGTWSGGSHVRPGRYASDCEKYNLAQMMGWRVLRYTADMIKKTMIYDDLLRIKIELQND